MTQYPQIQQKRPFWHRLGWLTLSLLGVTLLVTSCLGGFGGDNAGGGNANAPLSGPVTLNCSAACSDRGQCGTAADGVQRVLASSFGPVVESHDLSFPSGAPATIMSTVTRTLETVSTSAQFSHPFHLVTLSDGTGQGWVTEWCVAPPN